MTNKTIWIIVGVVAVIGLAYFASRVGGIAVRGVRSGDVAFELAISEPVVLGVDTNVRWGAVSEESNSIVTVQLRTAREESTIGSGQLADEQVVVQFPCDLGQENVGVSLASVDEAGQKSVIGWTTVAVLPPGPDCLR